MEGFTLLPPCTRIRLTDTWTFRIASCKSRNFDISRLFFSNNLSEAEIILPPTTILSVFSYRVGTRTSKVSFRLIDTDCQEFIMRDLITNHHAYMENGKWKKGKSIAFEVSMEQTFRMKYEILSFSPNCKWKLYPKWMENITQENLIENFHSDAIVKEQGQLSPK